MALNVDMSMNGGCTAGQMTAGAIVVTNLGANAVTLTSLAVTEPSGTGGISQPSFLALPLNTQPTIAAGAQATYNFALAPTAPAWAGQNADQTTAFRSNTEASEPLRLTCNAMGNDAVAVTTVTGQGFLTVGVKAAIRPNSPSLGGALQFNGSSNAVNSL